MAQVVLVDEDDHVVGLVDKLEAHRRGLLHRAFSVFLFRRIDGTLETLLQQRQFDKYHSGGLWANACCSHPLPEEPLKDAAHRRLKEELGLSCQLHSAGAFIYKAEVGGQLTEHEFDHIWIGELDTDANAIHFNPDEADAVRWMNVEQLKAEVNIQPERYVVWLAPALAIALEREQSPLN